MIKQQAAPTLTLCPDCKGRGLVRLPGEWHTETCPRCDGRGEIALAASAAANDEGEPAPTKT